MTDVENCCPGWQPGHLRPNKNSRKPAIIITASEEPQTCIVEMENERYRMNQGGALELLETSQIALESGEIVEILTFIFIFK